MRVLNILFKHPFPVLFILALFCFSCSDDSPTEAGTGIIVVITASSDTTASNTRITFSAQYSGTILSEARYVWTYGDGSEGSTVVGTSTSTHVYQNEGSYEVRLEVYDNISGDLHGVGTQTVAITSFASDFVIIAPDSSVFVGTTVSFTINNNGTSIPNARYEWSFGDGTTSKQYGHNTTVSHSYSSDAVYNVTCAIYDDITNTFRDSASVQLTVTLFPRPDLTNYFRLKIVGSFLYKGTNYAGSTYGADTSIVRDTVTQTLLIPTTDHQDKMSWSNQTMIAEYTNLKQIYASVELSADGSYIKNISIHGSKKTGTMSNFKIDTLGFQAENIPLVGAMTREHAVYRLEGATYMNAILKLATYHFFRYVGSLEYEHFLSQIISDVPGYIEVEFYKR